MEANVIIDTESEISIANSRYHTAIHLPGIDGKVIKPMGFFLHNVVADDIEVDDKFYMVKETDYDLIIIISRKAVEGSILRVIEDVVGIIIDHTVRVGYIKVNVISSKTDDVVTTIIDVGKIRLIPIA